MTTARKYRGKPAKIPRREVIFLATAREFRGNGYLNPESELGMQLSQGKCRLKATPAEREWS
jgi:hypothetical protein